MALSELWALHPYLVAFRVKECPDKNQECRRNFSLSFSTTHSFVRLSWRVGFSLFHLIISYILRKYVLIVPLSVCNIGQAYQLGSAAEVHRAIYKICCKRWHLYLAGLNRERGVAARILVKKYLNFLQLTMGPSLSTIHCMWHVLISWIYQGSVVYAFCCAFPQAFFSQSSSLDSSPAHGDGSKGITRVISFYRVLITKTYVYVYIYLDLTSLSQFMGTAICTSTFDLPSPSLFTSVAHLFLYIAPNFNFKLILLYASVNPWLPSKCPKLVFNAPRFITLLFWQWKKKMNVHVCTLVIHGP